MRTTHDSSLLRVLAAAIAAAVAISICVAQRHVRVVLSDPYTYASPLRHKCGLLMIGCVVWAMMELRRLLTREFSSDRREPVFLDGAS
jgi:hypothetical protein